MENISLFLTLIMVFLAVNTCASLMLVLMARRRGDRLAKLEQYQQRRLDTVAEHKQANLLLLAPLKGRTPLKLLNFSEAAIQIRRIERRHSDDPDEIALIATQDPKREILSEKPLLLSGDFAEVDIFADVPLQVAKLNVDKKKLEKRVVLAKITLNVHYFYSLTGDSNQETRFAVTLYAHRETATNAAGQVLWQEQIEIKRYT